MKNWKLTTSQNVKLPITFILFDGVTAFDITNVFSAVPQFDTDVTL